ncbi:MAG: hypothetical protein HRT36_03985 [Alphaproteobacteria bacterium]|nr:hypothetical protein [Alphaproteobacteria bacterium]
MSLAGKVILAIYSDADVRKLFGGFRFVQHIATSLSNIDVLLRDLEEICVCGWSFDRKEYGNGIF